MRKNNYFLIIMVLASFALIFILPLTSTGNAVNIDRVFSISFSLNDIESSINNAHEAIAYIVQYYDMPGYELYREYFSSVLNKSSEMNSHLSALKENIISSINRNSSVTEEELRRDIDNILNELGVINLAAGHVIPPANTEPTSGYQVPLKLIYSRRRN